MFGLISLVLVGVAIWLGFSGASWLWCLGLAAIGAVVYYGNKAEAGSGSQIVADAQQGAARWITWVYGTQVATMSILYGLGYLISAIF